MIRFIPSIENINHYQTGDLPDDSIKLKSPPTEQIMMKAGPIAVVLCLIMSGTMFGKVFVSQKICISPPFIIVGFLIGFILLIVHEWLHAVVYPRPANVIIGKLKKSITFVALASYPLKRGRFVLMSLLPFVLGIIPLSAFIISSPENTIFNAIMFGTACMGMVSPFPDVYNVYLVMRQTTKGDSVMFYQDDMYRIKAEKNR